MYIQFTCQQCNTEKYRCRDIHLLYRHEQNNSRSGQGYYDSSISIRHDDKTSGRMYVIIGCHFVPHEGKFLLIAIGIVRIARLNVILRQMPLNVR